MVGEPTTFTRDWFTAFGEAADATPLLATARALKTEQEVERMRLANDIAAAAMEHCRLILEPGMTEAQIAAEWEGFVHGEGTGWDAKVELALGFSLVWSGVGIKTFTATTSRPVVEGEPTLFEIWVCADGYWCDHTKNLVAGELTPRVPRARSRAHGRLRRRDRVRAAGREPRRARPSRFAPGSTRWAFPASRRIRSATASARVPTNRPTRTRRAGARSPPAWFLQSSQDAISRVAVVSASRTTSSSRTAGAEKLSPFPDGIVRA